MQHIIMAPKNTDVDEINNAIFESLFEEFRTYLIKTVIVKAK